MSSNPACDTLEAAKTQAFNDAINYKDAFGSPSTWTDAVWTEYNRLISIYNDRSAEYVDCLLGKSKSPETLAAEARGDDGSQQTRISAAGNASGQQTPCDPAKSSGNNPASLTIVDRAKNAFGKSIGQQAFNMIQDKVPAFAVGANVNSNVRALADAVNSGVSSYATSGVNAALGDVYSAAGINPNVLPANPNQASIFDSGNTAANFLADRMIAGTIEAADLPAPISALSNMANVQQASSEVSTDITSPGCGVSAYARDLIEYAPKHNFMFFVEFTFNSDYTDMGIKRHHNTASDIKFHMLSRQFTRPNVSVEYEDVNMYNFHTKVAKRVVYDPLNIKLFDDIKNESIVFLEKYLKARSPVARYDTNGLYETAGMDYQSANDGNLTGLNNTQGSSASMGGYVNDNRSILKQISVYHIFGGGNKVNRYTFINPKIMQFDMSDFDMENGTEPASIDIQVAYDSMFIESGLDVSLSQLDHDSRLGKRFLGKFGKQ